MAPKTWKCRSCNNISQWRQWHCSSCAAEFVQDERRSGWIDYTRLAASNVGASEKAEVVVKTEAAVG
eukprot:1349330-Karenia_brevis.AAC.1